MRYGRPILDAQLRAHKRQQTRSIIKDIQKFFIESQGDTVFAKLRNFSNLCRGKVYRCSWQRTKSSSKSLTYMAVFNAAYFMGGGLLTWAQFSAIYEPYNHTRRIVGFDTFAGFPNL